MISKDLSISDIFSRRAVKCNKTMSRDKLGCFRIITAIRSLILILVLLTHKCLFLDNCSVRQSEGQIEAEISSNSLGTSDLVVKT